MSGKGLARSAVLTSLFVGAGAALAFAATLAVSNAWGPSAAGQFFQVVALFTIATTLATFGADTGLVRTLPALTARGEVSGMASVLRIAVQPALALAAAIAAVGVLLVCLPGLLELPGDVRSAVLLAAPLMVLGTGMNLAFGALRGLHRVPTFSFLQNVLLPSLRLAGVLLVVVVGGGVLSLAAAWTVPVAVVVVLALLLVRRALPVPAPGLELSPLAATGQAAPVSPRQFWSFASARGVTAVVETLLEWIDVLLVALFLGPAAAGVYGVVNRCIRMGAMLDHTARMVTGPSISAALAVGNVEAARSVFTRTTTVLVAAAAPFYLTLMVFGPAVLSLFGDGFAGGYPALLVISAAMLIAVSAGGVQSLLLMAGRSRWQLMNKSAALLVALGLNLWLIPQWGLVGAATAWAASVLTDVGLALFQSVRLLGIAPRWRVVGGVLLLAVLISGGAGLLIRVLVGAGVSGLLVHATLLTVVGIVGAAVLRRRVRRASARADAGPLSPEEATAEAGASLAGTNLRR
ncbi:polysaccharide biosynthesis C-terminal domain-containing protein [Kocuria sp. CPCC 205258]|uniref:polysaccharide biosynthesis C-terminal domain-containing protein n=1 Tax=Kocuria sp. CPCC 205258 TaxID=3073552 RepID=UPI0034D6C911